jgi:hypothetical protein
VPVVPTLQSQVSPLAAPNFQQRPLQNAVGQDLGAGVADVGAVAFKIRKDEQLKADRAAFMEADRNTDTVANDLYTQAQSKVLKDAIGVAPDSIAQFDKKTSEIAQGLKSDRQKAVYQQSVNDHRAQLQRQLDTHERQQTEAYYAKSREDYKAQAHINAVTNYQDPNAIEGEIDKVRAAVDQTPGLHATQKADETGVRASGIYAGVVGRYLSNDNIAGAEKYYNSIRDKVNGDKASQIENAITDAKRIAENRARALADHRDAIAERTLNEIDRQIASGVPATPEMWAGWENKTRGTSFASEFKDRVSDEQDVQKLLRMPITDQVKAVQERQAALDRGGGTIREAMNLNRLKTAVTQNVTLLQQQPLQFNANRTGTDIPEVDLSALDDPAQQQALQSRVDTITAMRKQYGNQVLMKPLLPQEAQALAAQVNAANPQAAVQLFGKLRASVSSDEAYSAIMQQIAPDSPVKAYAGQIYGKPVDAIPGAGHWFRADDPAIPARVVAQTIVTGENLLNKTKQVKGEDGKPVSNLFLPNKSQFDTAFVDKVGDAFAGRPDAQSLALQVAYAYYVGKSAETGRLNSDTQDIDQRLVQQALKASIGTVVSFHGYGDVLAPLGMDESTFTDKAKQGFAAELAARAGQVSPAQAFARNAPYAKQESSYFTKLPPAQEKDFQAWVKKNNVPFDSSSTADYDMRGFYKGLTSGDPHAQTGMNANDGKLHFSDYYKTPYHQSFSAESKFATEGAPRWNDKDQLVTPDGKVVFDERALSAARNGASESFGSLGLRNWKANQYLVTKGREPFSLNGEPLVITVK